MVGSMAMNSARNSMDTSMVPRARIYTAVQRRSSVLARTRAYTPRMATSVPPYCKTSVRICVDRGTIMPPMMGMPK